MSFLRIFEHLLPRGEAWKLRPVTKKLRELFAGLTDAPTRARDFVDDAHDDLYPEHTRALEQWEAQFALSGSGTDADRRAQLDATWKALGGQSPRYIEDVLHAAGFTQVFVHDWWSSGPPYVARDPRLYTTQPTIGTVQCGEPLAQCGEPGALANAFLANEPGYIVNLDLTPTAPPPVPDDPDTWPYFLYFGSEVFGSVVNVPEDRRADFEELLLRICPAHLWLVTMVDYDIGALITDGGDTFVTETGDRIIASAT